MGPAKQVNKHRFLSFQVCVPDPVLAELSKLRPTYACRDGLTDPVRLPYTAKYPP